MKKNPSIRFNGFTDTWEQRKLSEISESYSGGTPSVSNRSYYGGSIPFIRSGEITSKNTELYITEEGLNSSSAKLVEEGDILYALYGATSGEVGISQINGAINQAILAIKPKIEYDSNFIMQWLRRQKNSIISTYLQGGQGNLSGAIVKDLTLAVPIENEEQTKIGTFFKHLDDTIALHQRQLDNFKELKKAMLQKMFPQNGEKVPEVRFEGFTEGWEQRKLGEWIVPYAEKTNRNNQYPVLTSSRRGIFLQTDYYNGNQIASEDNTGYNIVPRGYFTYRHMSDDEIFKFNINDIVDYGIVSTLYPVFTTKQGLDSDFLQYQLNNGGEFRSYATLQKQGGSRTYMYLSKLENLKLTIPELQEQIKISNFFNQLDQSINLHQQKVNDYQQIKKAMLQKMFV
ncbi:restriction endonuclease subunit S [Trichococcus ilyis]|uniref:Restriction endonuclease type i hsds n=1 Tax=Trichococcus ilyis TaxID=640938 RepID=A0A143YI26_9LACT|nr:restriction endonuclease subunit S [Trichococcus ilyis]CZQ89437.1 restriction endonuclease type i hsds [Trichococcus ilyis]SEI84261.1 type I restriction enzyme, S subunit [Trichococcus ilyis]